MATGTCYVVARRLKRARRLRGAHLLPHRVRTIKRNTVAESSAQRPHASA
jgi:hypothetical protein